MDVKDFLEQIASFCSLNSYHDFSMVQLISLKDIYDQLYSSIESKTYQHAFSSGYNAGYNDCLESKSSTITINNEKKDS